MSTVTPEYQVLKKEGSIEHRHYPSLLIAKVTVTGDRKQAANAGFQQLAGYIFGENQTSSGQAEKIAMTAPVLQRPLSDNQWEIQFVMPASYTLDTLPQAKNTAIQFEALTDMQAVVIRFSGRTSTTLLAKKHRQLKTYLEQHAIQTMGQVCYAFYNPPWTLPLLRRNEILYWTQS